MDFCLISDDFPFRSAYSPHLKVAIAFDPLGDRAKQSFKAECDINTIMARYMSTGVLPETILKLNGQYLDCTGFEFQSAMDLVADASSMFQELPSSIRSRFDNDPAAFLDFCSQEKNRPELADMGLLRPEVVDAMRSAVNVQQSEAESKPQ